MVLELRDWFILEISHRQRWSTQVSHLREPSRPSAISLIPDTELALVVAEDSVDACCREVLAVVSDSRLCRLFLSTIAHDRLLGLRTQYPIGSWLGEGELMAGTGAREGVPHASVLVGCDEIWQLGSPIQDLRAAASL